MNSSRLLGLLSLLSLLVLQSCAVSYPVQVTNNKVIKEGSISQHIWFGVRPQDMDLSIRTAAERGGIQKVATVDFLVETRLLGFHMIYTTRVTGE
jgi:hypothetical protein